MMKKKDRGRIQIRNLKEEVEEDRKAEAVPNGRAWDLCYGFHKPTPD